jgi:dihydrofolate reductase
VCTKGKESYVFTKSERPAVDNIKFVHPDILSFIQELKDQAGKNIWVVGGGRLIYHFLKNNLIDEMIVTVAPVILGKGIPLFREGDYSLKLSLENVRKFNQFVALHYKVVKS